MTFRNRHVDVAEYDLVAFDGAIGFMHVVENDHVYTTIRDRSARSRANPMPIDATTHMSR